MGGIALALYSFLDQSFSTHHWDRFGRKIHTKKVFRFVFLFLWYGRSYLHSTAFAFLLVAVFYFLCGKKYSMVVDEAREGTYMFSIYELLRSKRHNIGGSSWRCIRKRDLLFSSGLLHLVVGGGFAAASLLWDGG